MIINYFLPILNKYFNEIKVWKSENKFYIYSLKIMF